MRNIRLVFFLMLVLLSQSACTLFLVGGAAGAGGYYVAQDERSVGRIAEDAAITSKVNAEFVRDKYISAMDINVDTYEGVVTLTGHVSKESYIQRSASLARTVSGVKMVVLKLEVVPE